VPPPAIEHRIVHTGGAGAVVRYGLRSTVREELYELARNQQKTVEEAFSNPNTIAEAPKRIKAANASVQGLAEGVSARYVHRILEFIRESCAGVAKVTDGSECPKLTAAALQQSLDPCGEVWFALPGTGERACVPGERITLSAAPRYPGWTELQPATYDAFTAMGRVVLVLCDDGGRGTAPPCSQLIRNVSEEIPQCANLKRGYVDTSRHPELREKHLDQWRDVGLLENGRRYNINVPRPSKQLLTGIICGADEMLKFGRR